MNRFLYAEGNPWSMVDPSGHASAYEGGGCGPGGKYCGSTGNDQNFHKNIKTVVAKAHNDYIHHPRARMYDPESTPTVSSEWASGDTWGENTAIGQASSAGAAAGGSNRFGLGRNCTFRGCFSSNGGDAGIDLGAVATIGFGVAIGAIACIIACAAIALAGTAVAAGIAVGASVIDIAGVGCAIACAPTVAAAGVVVDAVCGGCIGAGGGTYAAGGSLRGVDLQLQYKAGWSASQIGAADAKVAALDNAAARGLLSSTDVGPRSGPAASQIWRNAGNDVPVGADIDHTIDLQLNGTNTITNLSPLDASVNRSLGAQIACQLRNVPVGTYVRSVSIC